MFKVFYSNFRTNSKRFNHDTDQVFKETISKVFGPNNKLTPRTLKRDNPILKNISDILLTVNERGGSNNNNKGFKAINKIKAFKAATILHNKQFYVLDLETLNLNNVETPFIMGTVIRNKGKIVNSHLVKSFNIRNPNSTENILLRTLDFIIETIPTSEKKRYVFAHNGSKFDTKVLLPFLTSLANNNTIEIKNVLADGLSTLFEINFTYKGITIILRDSIKILGASVGSLGNTYLKNIDERKITMNIQTFQAWFKLNPTELSTLGNEGFIKDLGIREDDFNIRKQTSIMDYITTYCLIDCKVVALSLNKFSKSIEIKGFIINIDRILTISSVAMKVYTTYFYNNKLTPIAATPSHTTLRKFIKNGYIGGRTEVLGSGIGMSNVYHFDIPGIYAQCININLPFGNPVFISKITKSAEEVFNSLHSNNIIGFFKATVTCPQDLWLPVLGRKSNGKLLFNTGTFTGTWTSNELELALQIGYKITLSMGYIYITRDILRNYSTTITEIKNNARSTGDTVTRAIAKLFRNSLYGKFAASYHDNTSQIVSEEELKFIESCYEITNSYNIRNNYWLVTYNTKPLVKKDIIEPYIQQVKRKLNIYTSPKPTNIAIRAAITSHGRIILYKLWMDVINQGGTLLYSDTDSVFAAFDEAPYGKTFSGFVWPYDDKGKDTFKNVLFIAPKIYYLEDINGNTKFAVKGVSNTSGFEYRDLVKLFVNKEKLTFTNQVKFRNLIEGGVMKGVHVNNDLNKVYDIYASVKREWVWVENILSTQPTEAKNTTDFKATTHIFKKIENKNLLITNLNTTFKWEPTTETTLDFGKQVITDIGDISISINITDEISKGFYHTTATIIANNSNIQTNNVKRVIITLNDQSNNIFKTVVHIEGENWRNYRMDNLITIINDKLISTIMEYQESFNPTLITFKVIITRNPTLVNQNNNIELAYNLSTTSLTRKVVKREFIKAQIELLTEQDKLLEGTIDFPETGQFRNEEMKRFKEWKTEVYNTINARIESWYVKEGIELNSPNRKILTDKVLSAFYINFEETGRITLHSFAEKIIDFIHSDRYRETAVKEVLIVAWTILSELTFRGLLDTYKIKTQNIKTKTATLYTAHTFFIRTEKSLPAALIITNRYIISKVSLTPIKTVVPQDFSKDIEYTLNKLNSTPVLLNIPYLRYLLELSYEDIFKMIDLKTEEEIQSIGLTWANSKIILLAIGKWYERSGKGHFYMKYIHDFRGRLYPELTHIRHISHKFLRPLFIPKDSPTFNNRILIDLLNSGRTDNKALEIWFNTIKQIPEMVELLKINRNIITIKFLAIHINNCKLQTVDWNEIARLREYLELIKENAVIIPSPIEYDAKASVLQHAAAISGNENILAILGIVEKEGINKEDIYLKTANMLVTKINKWIEEEKSSDNPKSDTIVSNLEFISKDLSLLPQQNLRSLAKKPLITKAYNASHFRLLEYVKKDLKDSNLSWRNEIISLFIIALKHTLTEVIIKEIQLMKQVQELVKDVNVPYGWTIRPNSDFKVICDNPIKTNIEVVLKSPLSKNSVHTTINVLLQGQNAIKNRNRIFVNIIHSIDALHIALIIKNTRNQILPIHDAILVAIGSDLSLIQETINETFKSIHTGNKTFIRIIEQLEKQTGNIRGIKFNKDLKLIKSHWVRA